MSKVCYTLNFGSKTLEILMFKTDNLSLSYWEKNKNRTYDVTTFFSLKKIVRKGWVSCRFKNFQKEASLGATFLTSTLGLNLISNETKIGNNFFNYKAMNHISFLGSWRFLLNENRTMLQTESVRGKASFTTLSIN